MSRVACKKFTVSRDSMVSRLAARVTRRKKLPTDRGKLSDKESGFESSPNSPRAESALEQAHHTPGAQELALRGAQEERVSLDSFEFIKKLGSGGYGSVVLVQKKGGRDHKAHYALKMTSLNRAALVERDILPRLENVPYTLDLAYAFCDTKLSKAYLVLPFAAGKDLFALAGPCSNPKKKPGYLRRMFHYNYVKYLYRVRVILAELCVAISHLHKLNILYRDLKLENILVFGDGHIRLADFGLSKLFEEGESTQISGKTGTPDYMAPEVLQSSGNFGAATTYSFEADLWGLGVIAYELVVGQLPFRGQEMAELEAGILAGLVEVPRSYLDEKFNRLARKERPLALAALSFVRALLQKRPVDRLTNAQIPHHIFFQDLDFAQIATGDHDDPPFDIRRIDAERRDSRDIEPIPAAFVGMVSINANKKSPDKSFDSPAKFANYHYVRRTSGWYFSDLEGSQCEDSRLDLPDNVGYDDEADFDISGAEQSCIALEDVPGLLEYEAILAEETSMESDDLVLVVPDHEPRREDVTLSTSIHRGLEDSPIEYMDEDEDYISSSPSSPDSAIDESAAESDAASSVPPMAASTPMKQEIELFPRVRVVNQGYYTTSPPCYSPNGPSSYASSSPCYSPNGKSPVARVMPNLLPVKSARRRLNLDDLPDSPSLMGGRMPQAPPSTPTAPGVMAPRRRRLQMDREMAAAASPALAPAATPRRHARKPLTVTLPDPGTPLRPLEDLWDSCSPLQQSCTPSRFERDSPLSPNQESCTPSRFERDSPLSPTASPEKTPRQEEQSSPAGARTWESLSPLQQSCTPSRFDRDSPLSPSPEKPKTPARKTGYKRGSPIVCGSPLGVIQRWWPSPQAPGFNASLGSPLVLVEAESLSETANLSGSGQSAAYPSARLEMLTRSARARAFLEQSARAEAAALGDQSSSSVASTSKRSWASPAGSEQGASRPRRRRAAAAAAAAALSLSAADLSSPSLPPKKRRRFRSPSPSPVRSLSQLGSDGPRVIVQATDQPQLQTYSLRSGRR